MITSVICKLTTFFDIIEFIGFIGISIVASIFLIVRERGLKIATKLGIKSIILIVLWVITGLITFYDAFIC